MVRIGISGWRYEPWRGVFYPKRLPQRRELEFAARHFPTLEINGSFYSLQRPKYYEDWYAQTPPGFVFAVKGSRYITHLKRLRDIEQPLERFFASGMFELRDKLGPFLWQLPPFLPYQPDRLQAFFEQLPRRRGRRPLRHAIEIRHESFVNRDFIALLREHDIGLVVADTAGKFPRLFDVTADFVYVRLHGDIKIYASGYTPTALKDWAKRIRAWDRAGLDVFVYFDNDMKVRAPFDALNLMQRLRLAWEPAGEGEFRMHVAGKRLPRLRRAYGPRVTGGNSAWQGLGRR
ncbi:MAG TPA: DUF72 domain-containing protein [Burkholderiales bacterium]|jgi:uncharacterized protein YecE (DUF72 family)